MEGEIKQLLGYICTVLAVACMFTAFGMKLGEGDCNMYILENFKLDPEISLILEARGEQSKCVEFVFRGNIYQRPGCNKERFGQNNFSVGGLTGLPGMD